MLGVICEYMMKEQGMCIKFCFILTETALESMKCSENLLLTATQQIECQVISHYPEDGDGQCLQHWCISVTWCPLSAQEDFIEFRHCRNFETSSMPSHYIQQCTTTRTRPAFCRWNLILMHQHIFIWKVFIWRLYSVIQNTAVDVNTSVVIPFVICTCALLCWWPHINGRKFWVS